MYVSDPQCMSSANNSAEWLTKNFGSFSRFASIVDFYKLNQNFSGVKLKILTCCWNQSFIHNSRKTETFTSSEMSSSLLSHRPAGGSSPLDSEPDGRDAAVESDYSTWERQSVWLPAKIPGRRKTGKGPALVGAARPTGNSLVMTDNSNFNALPYIIKCKIFNFQVNPPCSIYRHMWVVFYSLTVNIFGMLQC